MWRYPVQSMGGEKLGQCMLGRRGVIGGARSSLA